MKIENPIGKHFSKLRILVFAMGVLLMSLAVCPGLRAQVPEAQTGGSGQAAAPSPTTSDAPAAKPAAKPASATNSKSKSRKKGKSAAPVRKTATADASAEPDKVLYDRAKADLKGGRYTEGRLALQTLINTYPDSEYLAKAKLAVADSYFNEGGTSNLTQAIQEYSDFRTFFPFLDEAAYAQMQIGLAHFHMMEKADRDKTQAEAAEDGFQAFLLAYPTSTLVPKATQYLRDVQEILADGEYKIAYYYYTKLDYRASAARLVELTDRYPLYSQNDEALWLLGEIYGRAKTLSKSEDDKNHWGDLAAKCYAKIVRDYPLSKRVPEAKARLKGMARPIPETDPSAYARMQQEQLYQKQHHQLAVLKMPTSLLKGTPDFATAAHSGVPQLNPPNDVVSATDVLRPGAQGPSFTIAAGSAGGPGADTGTENLTPVDAGTGAAGADAGGTGVGAEIISTGGDAPPADAPAATAPPAGTTSPDANTPGTTVNPAPAANAALSSPNASGSTAAPAPENNAPPVTSAGAAAGGTPSPSSTGPADQAGATKPTPVDSKEESSSKKKKGIKKIIPW